MVVSVGAYTLNSDRPFDHRDAVSAAQASPPTTIVLTQGRASFGGNVFNKEGTLPMKQTASSFKSLAKRALDPRVSGSTMHRRPPAHNVMKISRTDASNDSEAICATGQWGPTRNL